MGTDRFKRDTRVSRSSVQEVSGMVYVPDIVSVGG